MVMSVDKIYEELIASGNEYYDVGDYKKALEKYEEASQLDPNKGLAWYMKGMALSQMGKFEEALMAYDMACKLDADRPEPYIGKGTLQLAFGKYEDAISTLKEAFTRQSLAEIACYISIAHLIQGNEDDALKWLNKAATIDKGETDLFLEQLYENMILNNDKLTPDEKLALKTMINKFKERLP